ncbi:hypothetical protein I3843_01G263600 [Carya illinoinensis]|nr:hypothetical protein I3843_01G263600 [Carya illinoinensis]
MSLSRKNTNISFANWTRLKDGGRKYPFIRYGLPMVSLTVFGAWIIFCKTSNNIIWDVRFLKQQKS